MNFDFNSLRQRISSGKGLSLLVGAASLALSVAVIPAVMAQSNTDPSVGAGGPGGCLQSRLNLTEEQQTQIESIRETERAQMDALLTADQRARLETARANQENPRQVFESLNLTDEQREQMRAIHEAAHEQIETTLTPEQRQQLPQRPPRGEQPPQ